VTRRTNKTIARQTEANQFITVHFGLLDLANRSYKYVSAGHPPPLLVHKSEEFLPAGNHLPIGVREDAAYRQHELSLAKNSFVVLYTDGLIEARRDGKFFGQENLVEAARKYRRLGAQGLVDGILADVESFSDYRLADDIALVAFLVS